MVLICPVCDKFHGCTIGDSEIFCGWNYKCNTAKAYGLCGKDEDEVKEVLCDECFTTSGEPI